MSKVNPRVSNPGFPPLPASTGLSGRPPDANKSVVFMELDWSGVQSASDGSADKSFDVAKDIVMGGDESDGGGLHGDDTVWMGVDQSGVVGGRRVSFKDMVLGNNGISQSALMVPDLDVDVQDEDVSIVISDVQNHKPRRSPTLRSDRGTIAGQNNSVVGVGRFAALDSSAALDELHNSVVLGDRGKAVLNSQLDSSVSKAKNGNEGMSSRSHKYTGSNLKAGKSKAVAVQISLDSRKHIAVKVIEKPLTAFDGRGFICKEGGRSLSGPARVQRFSNVKGDARQNPYVQRRKSIDNAENNDPNILHLGDWIHETYSKLALEASSSGIAEGVVAKVGEERDGGLPLCDDGDDTVIANVG
ncbi:hypothetical protein V6N12_036832 [Hibiscus sabdariffa]|uniref:Uncharacterized protein n=1 Tax=Hibiscus sabdariffa TaxID=183260 RepID=A0ABR2BUV0_9ROSI